MEALKNGNSRLFALLAAFILAVGIAGCDGDDGDRGAAGTDGTDGSDGLACWDLNGNGIKDFPDEDTNGDGVIDVNDCRAVGETIEIGDGSGLTEEQIEELGGLVADIIDVQVASPPVVTFTVEDAHGNPALGITGGVAFTIAKLLPAANGFPAYWQSYVNRVETANPDANTPNVLPQAVQATTDGGGTLVELGGGMYEYTFATDIADVTDPISVTYEPNLPHRVGFEIRLSGDAEPLAPDNPVYDFIPETGEVLEPGSNLIADTENCNACHYRFDLHGGPRRTVEYCVTCHNPGTIDQDTGESMDMGYMSHSIHPGLEGRGVPYIVYGYGDFIHDYSEVTYPQDILYCENCHEASEATPDGDAWNEYANAPSCGGCHATGLVALDPDPVTGVPAYQFDHGAAGSDGGFDVVAPDGTCVTCHLGAIQSAGPALAMHSTVDGSDRFRDELGDNFVYTILSATDTAGGKIEPGDTPRITFRVDKPDGTAWDILNDPEITALNLYVSWATADIYNGLEDGTTWGLRDNGGGTEVVEEPGYPHRMYLAAIQASASLVQNQDGSYTVDHFAPVPLDFTGDVMIALGGRQQFTATDNDGVTDFFRAYPVSAVYYPDSPRAFQVDSDNCNDCHEKLAFHGGNRAGDYEICLVCHNADLQIQDGELPVEGFQFGYMVHNIHIASSTWAGGLYDGVTYPIADAEGGTAVCEACHISGGYNVARATARAVSTGGNLAGDDLGNNTWLDDIATTPTSAACGTCHTSSSAVGHFASNAGQVGVQKDTIIGATPGVGGLPNGQEACAVCHGPGNTFDTTLYHVTPHE
ncbi:MAG: OmcA/MtrC family decaheme c-type cytochrome [Gammaproteobacteria bacterium]|jgi:OmcA/MtrC family decaheme c-type cytochrome